MAAQTDFAVPPGELLLEWLDENSMSQAALAREMGVSPKHVSTIVNGGPVTIDTALRLERTTGIASDFWNRMEALYRTDLARLTEADRLTAADLELLDRIPCAELRARGFIRADKRNKSTLLQELLSFFKVGSMSALRGRLQLPSAAFRKADTSVDEDALATWLHLGRMEAEAQGELAAFDKAGLEDALPGLRALTIHPPEHFGDELVRRFADLGVHLLYVRDMPRSATFGATWWLGRTPVVQLSLRRKDDGNFWFTLFHEVGHLLLHDRDGVFINLATGDGETAAEEEANSFSSTLLIPEERNIELEGLRSLQDVRDFAQMIGVSPGVVIGRLHHDRTWPFQYGNGLKLSLQISDDDDE